MAEMPKSEMQRENNGEFERRGGKVRETHVHWEMRLKVRPILMRWRVSLPVDTTAEAGQLHTNNMG
jgi:hypothetical protein